MRLFFSPEVVQSQPYGEKADVWASGCILYQMATLQPPFYSSNMLALATKVRHFQVPFHIIITYLKYAANAACCGYEISTPRQLSLTSDRIH